MKLTADQFYYVYFFMLEEPAMFKPLSYSSEFFSLNCFQLITQASRVKAYEQAVQIYLCQCCHAIFLFALAKYARTKYKNKHCSSVAN